MTLVAGVDLSPQSCKVLVCDAATGRMVRAGRANYPTVTEVSPESWWQALREAIVDAGGLDDVKAISVAGQQHGMVCLDESGEVVRDALLWNDTRSARAADDLIAELGGGNATAGSAAWAAAVGTVPVASLTVTKLRWLAEHETDNAERVAAVCLPHDWLSWRLAGYGPGSGPDGLAALVTDRSEASGTGYWSGASEGYRMDLLRMGLGHDAILPRVLAPLESALETPAGQRIGPGAGDNAAAALGLGLVQGGVAVSLGTSGVISAICPTPPRDATGLVAGFSDATGMFLPLACTLNASRVLDAAKELLGISYQELDRQAVSASDGANGLVMVPYLEGERTPNKPYARGAIHGLRLSNATSQCFARATVEGLLCLMADAMDAIGALGIPMTSVNLIGVGARSAAVCELAPKVFGRPVAVPPLAEYVALGAARQAAAVLAGAWPIWELPGSTLYKAEPVPMIREQYAAVRNLTIQ